MFAAIELYVDPESSLRWQLRWPSVLSWCGSTYLLVDGQPRSRHTGGIIC